MLMQTNQLQTVFHRVAQHLLAQGKRSENNKGCLYRGPDGLKCAIGVLIPDELYKRGLENTPADDPAVLEVLEEAGVLTLGGPYTNRLVNLLRQLQLVHDDTQPENWPARLETIAKEYDIKEV